MRKPEFRSSEPMKSWSLQSIHNPSCSSTEEHTGTPGLTGQTLTINKTTCGTWFIKKKHKKKKKQRDRPTRLHPACTLNFIRPLGHSPTLQSGRSLQHHGCRERVMHQGKPLGPETAPTQTPPRRSQQPNRLSWKLQR